MKMLILMVGSSSEELAADQDLLQWNKTLEDPESQTITMWTRDAASIIQDH